MNTGRRIPRAFLVLALFIAACAIAIEQRSAAAPAMPGPILLLTSDGEGHTGPCQTCPGHAGDGGLARRATLVSGIRTPGMPVLLLDAGNALFGPESLDSRGAVIVDAYAAMRYDAVNLSWRDFRLGKQATRDAIARQPGLAFVSVNLLDAAVGVGGVGKPFARPYVVRPVGASRVAVMGVTETPAAVAYLPGLRRQLDGLQFRPPIDALAEWLPKAKRDADRIGLFYYGSPGPLKEIAERFGGDLSAIGVGGMTSAEVPRGIQVPVIWAERHGRAVGRVGLDAANPHDAIAVDASFEPDPRVADIVARSGNSDVAPPPPPPPTTTIPPAPIPSTAPAAQPATSPPQVAVAPPLPRVTARQSRVPRGLAGVGLSPEQVNGAIERGRDFLWANLKTTLEKEHRRLGQSNFGFDDLVALALVHTGAQLKYPEFDASLRDYLDRLDPVHDSLGTYQAGILCMLIGDYADPKYLPKLKLLARSLVEQQLADGSWHYGRPVPEAAFGNYKSGPALSVQGGLPLDDPAAPLGEPLARSLDFENHAPGDNSTSQFAMLGLRAASRVRFRAAPQVWQRAMHSYTARRCAEGGWGYETGAISAYGSMTCAGICSIAIARHELGEKEPAIDPAIETGLAWLDAHFAVSTNPEHGGYLYYYLYSLERVGRILDTEFIGSHEWYPLGAQFLINAQTKDGSWLEANDADPRAPTSFALLFLTRATQTLNVEVKRGGQGQVTTSVATPPPARLYVILDASGSMLDEMDGRMKFDAARDAVAGIVAGLPDSAEVALRVYGHRKRSIEPGSDEDTALEYPLAKIDREKLPGILQRLRPRGKTPLALSLQQAKQDLSSISGQPLTVVLLTDGGEDTMPRRDPVKAAAEFGTIPNLTFHIVGFDINQDDWGQQLRAMAAASHGHYWPAARTRALQRQIRSAVFGIPDDFTLYDADAREVAHGEFGKAATLPEGKYQFRTQFAGQEFKSDLWVNTGASTGVIFDAQKVRPDAAAPATAPTEPRVAPHFCTHCGHPLPPGAKFCPSCGQPVPDR